MRGREGVAAATILLVVLALSPAVQAEEAATVTLMFDFGDGFLFWTDVALTDNRTALNATELAAETLGFEVEVVWFNGEAFVADIGERDPVFPYWWHLLLWNETAADWELSPVGASSLTLEDGDVIGWFLSADDPEWDFVAPWPGPKPLATPDHPHPAVAFRGNVANTGTTGSPAPLDAALKWRADLDGAEIGASAVGARGVVYQVTWNATWALELATGQTVWHTPEARGLSTPALVEGDLIVGSRDGRLLRLDGDTGRVEWSVVLREETGFTGIASSPTFHQGRVFVGTFNESGGAGEVLSLYAANGTVAWSHTTGSVHMSAPAVWNGSVYVGVAGLFDPASLTWNRPYGLLALHESNGTERWFFPTDGAVAASPAVVDDTVYFTARDGYLYALSAEGDLVFRQQVGPSTSSPAVGDGVVVAASGVLGSTGKVAAFATDGELLWEFVPNGPVQSSLTLTGDLVLFATNTDPGTVYALWAGNGTVAWSYVPQPTQYILPTPTVVDGHVLVASDNGFFYTLVSEAVTRPTVTITSPAAATTVPDATVTVTGTASDDVEVVRVEVRWDGSPWMEAAGTTEWEVTLVLPEGTHTLTARVTDNAGNVNTTSVEVTVQLAPDAAIPLVYVPILIAIVTALVLAAAVYWWYARKVKAP